MYGNEKATNFKSRIGGTSSYKGSTHSHKKLWRSEFIKTKIKKNDALSNSTRSLATLTSHDVRSRNGSTTSMLRIVTATRAVSTDRPCNVPSNLLQWTRAKDFSVQTCPWLLCLTRMQLLSCYNNYFSTTGTRVYYSWSFRKWVKPGFRTNAIACVACVA